MFDALPAEKKSEEKKKIRQQSSEFERSIWIKGSNQQYKQFRKGEGETMGKEHTGQTNSLYKWWIKLWNIEKDLFHISMSSMQL